MCHKKKFCLFFNRPGINHILSRSTFPNIDDDNSEFTLMTYYTIVLLLITTYRYSYN